MGLGLSLALPGAGAAADAAGQFAIKGAGAQTCTAFLASWDAGSPDLALYAGWIDGYLTGMNQTTPDTYDLASWQTAETLMGLVRSVCGAVPGETGFLDAFHEVQRLITPSRLTEVSPLVALVHEGQSTVAYAAVVQRVQARLAALGHAPGPADGTFRPETAAALAEFQATQTLPQTGLPDQRTLFALFRSE